MPAPSFEIAKRLGSKIAFASVAILAFSQPGLAAAEAPRWQLAWQDDFDQLDTQRWKLVDSVRPTNNSLHAYLPEQLTIEDGKLVITAVDEPYQKLAFRSGQVISRAEQRLGRWEVRAKLPTTTGMWPAIWLLPDVDTYPWPSGGEIDIMENRGNEPHMTSSAFHYGTRDPYKHDFVFGEQRTRGNGRLANYHTEFHTYAVDWTDRYLRFYVDGVHYYTVHDEDVDGFLSAKTEPMQLVINNAIGGKFLTDPDASTRWPQRMEVDWVRVYQLVDDTTAGQASAAQLTNGGFEQAGGWLAGWSLFGANEAAVQHAQITREVAVEGVSSLKLTGAGQQGGQYTGVTQGISVRDNDRVEATLSAFVPGAESLAGSTNRLVMKFEFYDAFGSKYGDGLLAERELEIANAATAKQGWKRHKLAATAPRGAAEARLAIVFDQPRGEPGAVFIDQVELDHKPADGE